jgi:hypothetical protein
VNKKLSKKTLLFTHILPVLKKQAAYFSLEAVKRAVVSAEIDLAEVTLWEYMSVAMASGIVHDAGRGWYSRHDKLVDLDPKPVAKVIRIIEKAFPLLDFCCWSTIQFNPFAQHLIAQPMILLYLESDTLESVAECLREANWDAWPNPDKHDVESFIRPGEKTIILRPAISKQPEGKNHVAPIEKALVDLIFESSKLQMMDPTEAQQILETVLRSGLIQLPIMFGYAKRKKQNIQSKEIT